MGVVYRAYHVPLARTGAVKVMHGISPDPDSIARFRREAQAIAQMRHPNILNVFDYGEYQGTPYMIVEYVPGGSLAAQMKKGPLDAGTALEYLDGIAAGLDYAHSLGIVHRDVKPANVLVARDGTPIIADFGLVKLLQSATLNSMTGATTGTPAYMAPEQVTGSQVGPAADRYSLATMAYEMLTGAFPFQDDSVLEMLYAHVHRDPVPPRSRRPELPSGVDAVILRGIARDAGARWESCAAFVAALRSALEAPQSPAVERTVVMAPPVAATVPIARAKAAPANATVVMPMPAPVVADATPPMPVASPVSAAIPTKKSRRRLYTMLAAALLLVLLVGTCGLVAALKPPMLTLSATTVHPGDSLTATASHVPANQAGEVQLLSRLSVFPFRADAKGNVTREILVPSDTALGSHTVKLCWSGTCHAQAALRVVDSSAFIGPPNFTPGTSPSPGASPGASPTSNPRRSPTPTSGTGGTGTTKPSPSPTHAPSPPPPSPTPTPPPPQPYVRVGPISTLNGFTVTFHYFASGGSWSVTVVAAGTPRSAGSASVPSGSTSYSQHFATPLLVVAGQSAYIQVCNSGTCYNSNTVTVGL